MSDPMAAARLKLRLALALFAVWVAYLSCIALLG